MRWPIHINVPDLWGLCSSEPKRKTVKLPIRHAEQRNWRGPDGYLNEQRFDGRYAYLYAYEASLACEELFEIVIDLQDLHVLYVLETSGLEVRHAQNRIAMTLQAHTAQFLTLPAGVYQLVAQKGEHLVFGAILDAGIFRPPADRAFRFLKPILENFREKSGKVLSTPVVKICEKSQRVIRYLLENLNPKEIDNEIFISQNLYILIKLNRDQHFDAYVKLKQPTRLAERTKELLEEAVMQHGIHADLGNIATLLKRSRGQVSKTFKEHYGMTQSQYRQELVFKALEHHLKHSPSNLLELSERLGFAEPSSVSRFHTRLMRKKNISKDKDQL